MNEARAKFEAVSCPELPLAAWISHLDEKKPLTMGLWWVEAQRYSMTKPASNTKAFGYKKVKVLMPSHALKVF